MEVTQWPCFYLLRYHRELLLSHGKPSSEEEEEGSPSMPRAAWAPRYFSTYLHRSFFKDHTSVLWRKSQEPFCLAFSTLNGEVQGPVGRGIFCCIWKRQSVLLLCFRLASGPGATQLVCLVPSTQAFALEKARASAPGATTESEEELCFH